MLQIGDGVILISDDASEAAWAFWPQHGEYVNSTLFLTDLDAPHYMQVTHLPCRVQEMVLMSDGLERLALHHASQSVYQPFYSGVMRPLRSAASKGEATDVSAAMGAFLASERVRSRTDDDVSLILATRCH